MYSSINSTLFKRLKHYYNNDVFYYLIALVITTFFWFTTDLTLINNGFDSDGEFYGAMAQNEIFKSDAPMPFKQRILVPFIVSLLPFSTITSFKIVAFICCYANLLIFYHLFHKLKFPILYRYFGLLLYVGVFWSFNFSFFSPCYPDYASQLLLLGLLYLVFSKNYFGSLLLLCLAALHKEIFPYFGFYIIADYLIYNKKELSLKKLIICILVLVVPFMCQKAILWLGTIENTSNPIKIVFHEINRFRRIEFWPVFLHSIISGSGIIFVIFFINIKSVWLFIVKYKSLIVYIALSIFALFGGVDKSRLFNYLLPINIVLAVNAIFMRLPKIDRPFILWFSIIILIHLYLGGVLTPIGDTIDYLAKFVPEHASEKHMKYLFQNMILTLAALLITIFYCRKYLLRQHIEKH